MLDQPGEVLVLPRPQAQVVDVLQRARGVLGVQRQQQFAAFQGGAVAALAAECLQGQTSANVSRLLNSIQNNCEMKPFRCQLNVQMQALNVRYPPAIAVPLQSQPLPHTPTHPTTTTHTPSP